MTILWAPVPPWLAAAGYMMTGLVCLAIGPAAFTFADRAAVVHWSGRILDLVGG